MHPSVGMRLYRRPHGNNAAVDFFLLQIFRRKTKQNHPVLIVFMIVPRKYFAKLILSPFQINNENIVL